VDYAENEERRQDGPEAGPEILKKVQKTSKNPLF